MPRYTVTKIPAQGMSAKERSYIHPTKRPVYTEKKSKAELDKLIDQLDRDKPLINSRPIANDRLMDDYIVRDPRDVLAIVEWNAGEWDYLIYDRHLKQIVLTSGMGHGEGHGSGTKQTFKTYKLAAAFVAETLGKDDGLADVLTYTSRE